MGKLMDSASLEKKAALRSTGLLVVGGLTLGKQLYDWYSALCEYSGSKLH